MTLSKKTIILAEDQNLVRQGVKALLLQEGNIDIIREAGNGIETLKIVNDFVHSHRPQGIGQHNQGRFQSSCCNSSRYNECSLFPYEKYSQ